MPAGGFAAIAPNPFNPKTTIEFVLTRPNLAQLNVYNIRGELVKVTGIGRGTDAMRMADRPHVDLFESYWDEAQAVAIERFYIVDAETSEVTPHSISTQAYTDEQYHRLLQDAGFADITFYSSLIGQPDERQKDFIGVVAQK